MSDTTAPPDILANLAPVLDHLKSAQRYGLPMPYSITVDGYKVTIQVWSAADIAAWSGYLEQPITVEGGDTKDHHKIAAKIEYTDVPIHVVAVLDAAEAVAS
jgi:hypothetical protein